MDKKELAIRLAETAKPENKDELLKEIAKLVSQSQIMIEGLPRVVDAMDEIIERLRRPPRVKEGLEKVLKEGAEGDLWNPEVVEKITGFSSKAQEVINDIFKEKRTEISSVRALARTQIILAHGLQSVGLMALVLGMSSEVTTDIAALLQLLQEKEEEPGI